MVTETDRVAQALDIAAEHWPAERNSRGRLLLRLIEEGRRALHDQPERIAATRRGAVADTSGALTGVYPENYLTQLREDWAA